MRFQYERCSYRGPLGTAGIQGKYKGSIAQNSSALHSRNSHMRALQNLLSRVLAPSVALRQYNPLMVGLESLRKMLVLGPLLKSM